jgi:hypothetical protein
VPGQSGYDARRGYDLASGLGTVDVANLVNGWNITPPRTTLTTLSSPAPMIVHGQPFPLTVSVAPVTGTGTPTGFFALETDQYGAFLGDALTNGTFNGSVSSLPGGQYNLKAHYGGDTVFAGSDSNSIGVTILPEDSTLSIGCITLNFAAFVVDCFGFENYGQPTALTSPSMAFPKRAPRPAASTCNSTARRWRRCRCRTALPASKSTTCRPQPDCCPATTRSRRTSTATTASTRAAPRRTRL